MQVAFRIDASAQVGSGHFMRSLALANALRRQGGATRFVCRQLPEHLRLMLHKGGHEFVALPPSSRVGAGDDLPHSGWLGASQAQDAQETLAGLGDRRWDWVVADHYALDARWESALRSAGAHVMVIDDLADREHDCDVLVDQNLYADMDTRYTGKVPVHCRLLLGPRYALLREEFDRLHVVASARTGEVTRVLISFGGADSANHTAGAIDAVAGCGRRDLHVDVVIGAQYPWRDRIESACKQHGFFCHVQTDRMAEFMAAADLAVGAGGIANWERCCVGLPALAICVAENQRRQVEDSAVAGLLYAPQVDGGANAAIGRHVRALLENPLLRQSISANGLRTVDGRGALRVALQMNSGDVQVREALADDSRNLFEWRNHPSIRAVSRQADLIEWTAHQAWFTAALANENRVLLIGHRDADSLGVVRFDIDGADAEVSIYLVPGGAAPGTGSALLRASERWIAARRPELKRIRATVLAGNERSHRLFAACGYSADSSCYSKLLGRE